MAVPLHGDIGFPQKIPLLEEIDFFTKNPKNISSRAKTVKNEFPTHESTYPYVFRFFLEIFWPNKKKLSVTKV